MVQAAERGLGGPQAGGELAGLAAKIADQRPAADAFAGKATRGGRPRLLGAGVQALGAALGRGDGADEAPLGLLAPGPRRGQASLGGGPQLRFRQRG